MVVDPWNGDGPMARSESSVPVCVHALSIVLRVVQVYYKRSLLLALKSPSPDPEPWYISTPYLSDSCIKLEQPQFAFSNGRLRT